MVSPDSSPGNPETGVAGYVDLHTHLVPGVDDGAASRRDAELLLKNAVHTGTAVVVATPHLYPGLGTWEAIEKMLSVRDHWIEDVNRECSGVSVLAGAEIHCTHALMDALERFDRRISLNGSDYFLLEFPFDVLFPGIEGLIFQMLQAGWIPVIAHPERNEVIQRSPGVLYRMVRAGALAQVNAGSLEGRFGESAQRSAIELLAHHLVHVVASDAHWPRERPADLSLAASLLEKLELGEPDLFLRRNPARILRNQGLELAREPEDPKKNKGLLSGLARRLRRT